MSGPRGALAVLGLVVSVWASVQPAVQASVGGSRAAANQVVFVFDGRGHGHGVGMAQDSADAMAGAGVGYESILEHFYPGTGRSLRQATVRVDVWEAGSPTGEVSVSVPTGAKVFDGQRSATASPGAVLQISVDASGYHVRTAGPPARGEAMRTSLVDPTPSPTSSTTGPLPMPVPSPTSASPQPQPDRSPTPQATSSSSKPTPGARASTTPTASPSASAAATTTGPFTFDSTAAITVSPLSGGTAQVGATSRRYRGDLLAIARSGFRLVNALDVEDYLRGMGEVPASWPTAALETQAVAARTYALRAIDAGHPLGYDLCDDTRCQVYLGVSAESARTADAVSKTRGEVLTYGGTLADAFYSANAGGITANPTEGFGSSTSVPYLPAGTVAAGDPAPWKVSATPADIAHRLGYQGQLQAISVTQRGPSGRALRLRLEGTAGSRELSAISTAGQLGLWSTLFTVSSSMGTAMPLPAPATALQLPPDQVAVELAPPSPTPSALPGSPAAAATRVAREAARPVLAIAVAAGLILLLVVAIPLAGRRFRRAATT